ncbi:alcohol dehydrogenase [Rhizoctonia solani AG-1 IA]|uniref:Alcohol dehydrogenase n=1 Tax=Thanatephorus cucumeris (strain AG1-IA) TaxID=983506 RepID=L8X047_THACA|nr:alcohol dehydrogenase [Rhizoctonia solani AG-1 IA]
MKAIVIDHYAHPSKQPVTNQASEPKPAADEVLVEVHSACAIVHPSTSERSLIHMRLHSGAYAERVAAKWQNLHPIPNGFSFEQAAGLFVTWPTSYEALVGRAQLQPGEWLHAAAGGVGLAAVQIAKALGAKVIATAGTQDKLKVCKTFGGADEVLDYTKSGWQKEVLKLTNGKGVDVIYDPVGLIKDSLKCIAWKGRALVVGFAAGEIEKCRKNGIASS